MPRPKRTHCQRGHPLDEANTYTTPKGKRKCRECQRRRRAEHLSKPENYQKHLRRYRDYYRANRSRELERGRSAKGNRPA